MATDAKLMTVDEFLEMERASEVKYEFISGEVREVPGASLNHVLIVTNLIVEITTALRNAGSACRALTNDIKVRTVDDFYSYPDLVVACPEASFEGKDKEFCVNPTVIVEVLSPSTEAYDRGEKFRLYERIPTLLTYVLVSQKEAQVELFERDSVDDRWQLSRFEGLSATCLIASLDLSLTMDGIYRGVELDG